MQTCKETCYDNTIMTRPRVALIVETSLAYGRAVMRGINRYIVANGPWSIYLELHDLFAPPPAWLADWNGDGIISRSTTPELAEIILSKGIPAVDMTDRKLFDGLNHLFTNNAVVGQLAAAHLTERGFRHFAFCGFTEHRWSRERREGFAAALNGIPHSSYECFETPWDSTSNFSWEEQQAAIAAWLSKLPKPVGIMACNDLRGQHVLDACRNLELAVPEAVAVIGVDNEELVCDLCDPPLSSVILNPEKIGYEGAALLDRLMAGDTSPPTTTFIDPLGIITRQSTDVLAIDDPQVALAVRLVRENACSGLAVSEILVSVPLSRSVLERRFRKYLGRSPQEELRETQWKRVKQLLAETDLTLEQIARSAGFPHPEYLSVAFKREQGMTPGAYRKQVQTNNEPGRW